MREKTFSIINIKKYFRVLKGVKMPWFLIIFTFVFSIMMMTMELEVATLTAAVIDTSQNAIDPTMLIHYIGSVAVTAGFSIVSYYFTRKMEETITLRVRVKLWNKIICLPTKYYDADNGDELIGRVTSDAASPSSLFTLVVSCVVCTVTTIQAFIKLFSTNTMLATYSLLIIPLTLIVCVLYSICYFKLGVYSTATFAGSIGYLAERVRNFRLIKSAMAEKKEYVNGKKNFNKMYLADFLNWLMIAGYQLAQTMFSIMFIIIVFVIGGKLIPSGEVTIGDLTSFYLITGIVSLQLMQFFMNVGSVSGTFGTMKRIAEVMDMESENKDGKKVPEVCSDIVFNNVSFAYTEERDVLNEFSIRIPKGKVTAIIGGNGAGKSTIFKLIARMYEPKNGEILFGDENIQTYEVVDWRNRFAYVFQKNGLIGGTVRENILYGLDRKVSEEEMIEAAKKANCYECIMEKPDGFDEDVGLGGSNFSGGQAQCISIARAMLRGTDYLLLDEATSNLDAVSEALVTDAMNALMKDKTTIMIAHNYAATRNADYVIVMKDGTLEAAGTPQELLETNEYYQMFSKML